MAGFTDYLEDKVLVQNSVIQNALEDAPIDFMNNVPKG